MKKFSGYGDPRFYALLRKFANTHSRKNQDYAKGSAQGHLGNFKRSADFLKLYPGFPWDTPFGIAIIYALKQLDAALILASTQRDSITGEPVTERLKDVAVYSAIASILWDESHERRKDRKASKPLTSKALSKLQKK